MFKSNLCSHSTNWFLKTLLITLYYKPFLSQHVHFWTYALSLQNFVLKIPLCHMFPFETSAFLPCTTMNLCSHPILDFLKHFFSTLYQASLLLICSALNIFSLPHDMMLLIYWKRRCSTTSLLPSFCSLALNSLYVFMRPSEQIKLFKLY